MSGNGQGQQPEVNPRTPVPTKPSDAFGSKPSTKPSAGNPSGKGGR